MVWMVFAGLAIVLLIYGVSRAVGDWRAFTVKIISNFSAVLD